MDITIIDIIARHPHHYYQPECHYMAMRLLLLLLLLVYAEHGL